MFEEIRKLIERYDTIILHRHLKPDGDALGSQIGLKHLILDNYPGKQVYMVGDEAGRYAFMADCAMDTVTDAQYAGALAILKAGGAYVPLDPDYPAEREPSPSK